jgi:hypothetical protein
MCILHCTSEKHSVQVKCKRRKWVWKEPRLSFCESEIVLVMTLEFT